MLAQLGVLAQAGAPSGPELPIDWSTDLLFARASAATHWDGTAFTAYASGAPRILGDGSLYVEGSRTNVPANSAAIVGSAACTVTNNASVAPDGTTTADRGVCTGNGGGVWTTGTGIAASVWIKYVSGDAGWQMSSGASANITATSSWVRHSVVHTTSVATPFYMLENGGANNAGADFWGWQREAAGAFASQLIVTTGTSATRLADDAVIEDADVPAAMRSGSFRITIKPRRASTQANDTTTGTLLAFGTGTDNRIYIDASNHVLVRQGAATKVDSGALTWSADQAITLTFDAAAGSVIVSGATTGNGTTTTTAWTMPSGDVQVGNDAALGTAFFGSISPPVAP